MTRVLRRRWWMLVIGAVLGATAGFIAVHIAAGAGDLSTAEVLLSAGPDATRGSAVSASSNQYVNQRTATDVELVTSDAVLLPAARELGVSVAGLRSEVSATAPDDASVITIAARGSSPENARRTADAVTTSVVRVLPALETPDPAQPARSSAQVVRQPTLPGGRPSPLPATLVGGLAGIVLVGGCAAGLNSGRARRTGARIRAWITAEP